MNEAQLRLLLDFIDEVAATAAETAAQGYVSSLGPSREAFIREFIAAGDGGSGVTFKIGD